MSLSLRAKLIGGFSIVAFIALVIGVIGWWGVGSLSAHLKDIAEVRMLRVEGLMTIDRQVLAIIADRDSSLDPEITMADKARIVEDIRGAREKYAQARKQYEATIKPDETGERDAFKNLVDAIASQKETTDFVDDGLRRIDALGIANPLRMQRDLNRLMADHHRLANKVANFLLDKKGFEGGEDHTTCGFGKWVANHEFANASTITSNNVAISKNVTDILDQAAVPHAAFHAAVAKIKRLAKDGKAQEAQAEYFNGMLPAMDKVLESLTKLYAQGQVSRDIFKDMNRQVMVEGMAKQENMLKLLNSMIAENVAGAETARAAAQAAASWAETLSGVAVAIGVLAALLLGIVIATSVTRSLNRIIDGLNSSSDQVSAAADQVSSAGQDLAQGASEQASSLEETSASLEEMNSMTKQNAENAYNADAMAKTANGAAEEGVKAMDRMSDAINKIKGSSDQTAKIIKTIDEIAFQTNLLALNAAVEAARAGEAGKGFAVVAEEVRNLAQRSAEAAKTTSALIEGAQSNSEEGVRVAKEVGESLAKINGNVGKVGALISEISAASGEQAKGIDQINRAVAEMDKLTQQNASNSEESASAAEELSAQAGELKGMVCQLVSVVTGNATEERVADLRRPPRRPQPQAAPRRQLAPAAKAAAPKHIPASQAEKAIPLDDDDFKDF